MSAYDEKAMGLVFYATRKCKTLQKRPTTKEYYQDRDRVYAEVN